MIKTPVSDFKIPLYVVRAIAYARSHPVWTNTFSTLLVRGATTGTRLIVLFIMARLLVPAEFGLVAFVLSIIEIVKTIADFGIDTFVIREFAVIQELDKKRLLAANVAFTKLICSIIGYIVILGLLFFYRNPLQTGIGVVLGILIGTTLGANFSIDYFQSQLRMNELVLPVLIINACAIVVLYIVSLFSTNVIVLTFVLPLAETITALILIKAIRREVIFSIREVSSAAIITVLQRSAPIAGTIILVTAYTRLDVIFLNSFYDSSTVGYYSMAYRLTEPFQLIAATFATSVFSHLSRLLAENTEDTQRVILRYMASVLGYGLLSYIFLVFIAPIFIRSVLPAYVLAIPILRVLALALVFRTLNGCLTAMIQAHGYFSYITFVAFGNLIVINGLLLVCLPLWGAIGAALALLIGEIVNTFIQLALIWKLQYRLNHTLV